MLWCLLRLSLHFKLNGNVNEYQTQTIKGFNNVTVHYFSKKEIVFQVVLEWLHIVGLLLQYQSYACHKSFFWAMSPMFKW